MIATADRVQTSDRDRGSVLPLVLVITVVLSLVVIGVANYSRTGLVYGQVVESRADRLAAADGGMRYAVEQLRLKTSLCGTSGISDIDPPDINGTEVRVTCTVIDDGFGSLDGWALVLTGEGLPGGSPLLRASGSSSSVERIGGRVYLNSLDPSFLQLNSPVEFDESQVWYGDSDCTSTPTVPPNMLFGALSAGLVCTLRPWSADDHVNGMFSAPSVTNAPAATDLALPPVMSGDCRVFHPGTYTAAPALHDHNYFMAGEYRLEGFAWSIANAQVVAGWSDTTLGDTQYLDVPECAAAIAADETTSTALGRQGGATFYLAGGATIRVGVQAQLEILRRRQGDSLVSIQSIDSTLGYADVVLDSMGGNTSDLVVHGMVWAPTARLQLGNVTNISNGQLLGGSVVSNVDVGSSASAMGFSIYLESTPAEGLVQLDSTATIGGLSTTIRSVIEYRPTTAYTAVKSWRVID